MRANHVATTEATARDFSRAELLAHHRTGRWRVLSRLAAGVSAAAIAVGIAAVLWSFPSPSAERSRLLAKSVATEGIASRIGVLLDPGTVDIAETRMLYTEVLEAGVPAFEYQWSLVGNARVRLDATGNRMITCDSAIHVWTMDGARVADGELTSGALDCIMMGNENRALVLAGDIVHEYEWSAFSEATRPGSKYPGRELMQPRRYWALPPIKGGGYYALVPGASPREIIVAGQSADAMIVSMFLLDNHREARLVARHTLPITTSAVPTLQWTAQGAIIASVRGSRLTLRGFPSLVVSTRDTARADRNALPPAVVQRALPPAVTHTLRGSPGVVAVNPSGNEVVVIDPPEAKFVDLVGGRILATAPLAGAEKVFAVAYDPTGDWVAVGKPDVIELRPRNQPDRVASRTPISSSGGAQIQLGREGRMVVLNGATVAVFRTDRQLPPPTAPWSEIIAALRVHTSMCMPADSRQSILLEAPEVAQARFETCETGHGRPPAPVASR